MMRNALAVMLASVMAFSVFGCGSTAVNGTGDQAQDIASEAAQTEGRWTKLYDAEKIVMDEAVIFPLYTQCNAELVSAKVSGVDFHPVALNRVYKDAVKAY